MIDEELRKAAADLREELSLVTPPPFKPRTELGGRVLLVAASVAVFAIGLAVFVGAYDRYSDPVGEPDQTITDDREIQDPELTSPDLTEDDADDLTEDDETFGMDLGQPSPGPAVTDRIHRPVTEMARPGFGQFVLEPEFGTIIAAATSATDAGIVVPIPQGASSWNADGSLLVLYETGALRPGHVLYDGRTFERIAELPVVPVDIEQLHWDPVRPDRLYFTSAETLRALDLDRTGSGDGRETVIASLDDCGELSIPQSQQPISADGAWMGLMCTNAFGTEWVALNLETGEATRTPALGPTAPLPTADGNRFVVITSAGSASVVDANFEPDGPSFQVEANQILVLRTDDGRDLLVTTIFDSPQEQIGSVVGYDLATGNAVLAIAQGSGFPYPPGGTNISSALGGNGLVVVSIRGAQNPADQDTLDGEVLLVDFNLVDPIVYRLAHHRSEFEESAFDEYRSIPWVAIDPAGTRVLFSSHWGGDRVDTFVIDIGELRSS